MRVRLSVQRNRLPPTNILWTISETNSTNAYSIARLLEDVNHVIPLEADHWGLDDYAVEVGGFECLHFAPVFSSLKDDDLVCIRPLLTAEIRARTLCGRNQISEGGQHLLDGIPFGRPYLRDPSRPPIRIPPRKRQRLLKSSSDTVAGGEETLQLPTSDGEVSRNDSGAQVIPYGSTNGRANRTVQFNMPDKNESDSDESDDEDFAPDQESAIGSDGEGDISSTGTSSSESSEASSDDADSSSDDSSESSTDSESDSGESEDPEVLLNIPGLSGGSAPGTGSSKTRVRNKRRKDQGRLQRLKNLQVLDGSAGLKELRAYYSQKESQETPGREDDEQATPVGPTSGAGLKKRKRDDRGTELSSPEDNDNPELQRRKRELMAKLGSTEDSSNAASKEEGKPEEGQASSCSTSANRRLKPNVSAIQRILGHQARSFDKSPLKAKTIPVGDPVLPVNANPELWKSKLQIAAFECWEEDRVLSAPPFPFQQHWDPASELMRSKRQGGKRKKKRKGTESALTEVTDPIEEEDTIVLDYGDAMLGVEKEEGEKQEGEKNSEEDNEDEKDKDDADASTAIESQLLEDVATAANKDLPPLPDNVEQLPTLQQSDIQVGAIIVFKVCELNLKTMQPEFSGFKTAVVDEEGDSGNGAGVIGLRLAERDRVRREKKFDKHGQRIWERADNFRIEDSDEEEDGEQGIVHYQFNELLEAKLLRGA